jgi:hypothetical protein
MDKINVWLVLVGTVVTITASIGGSYVTTKVNLAVHAQEIEALKRRQDITDKKLELLYKIDKTVAVIEERTKDLK